ncbi:hypothetical protein [Carboxylicivirga taeanensis]|uniref:hypothetical protein n=1 Tax=Carboxylicivirga taeanensis TaxID=1416875 RepID=UPI003F6DEB97
MEFVFQILADLLSPVDEKQVKAEVKQAQEKTAKESVVEQVEEVETEQPNIFGVMDFH